jgi:hypothetical protein
VDVPQPESAASVIEDVVEILRRQLDFLLAQEGSAVFVQLGPYIDAIEDDPRVKTILDELATEVRVALSEWDQHDADMVQRIIALRQALTRLAPDLDDSSSPPDPEKEPFKWAQSLAAFDAFARMPRGNQFPNNVGDRSEVPLRQRADATDHAGGGWPASGHSACGRVVLLRRVQAIPGL